MKDSEIYRRAAELIDARQYYFSCNAVDAAAGKPYDLTPQRGIYNEIFKPRRDSCGAWGAYFGEDVSGCRVLALLFMSAIAADEERAAAKKRSRK